MFPQILHRPVLGRTPRGLAVRDSRSPLSSSISSMSTILIPPSPISLSSRSPSSLKTTPPEGMNALSAQESFDAITLPFSMTPVVAGLTDHAPK